GIKGQKSRSGVAINGYEGGQMPLYMRLPKRGFNNVFRKNYVEVNLGRLQAAIDAGKLDAGKPVDSAALLAAGVISKPRDGVRILGKGELTAKKVEIHAAGASKAAIAAVEKAGGKIVVPVAVAE
ncbi:MAG: 50S ribosomal protein L15, partial [Candidatus Puniceispirillaceae bacterium]